MISTGETRGRDYGSIGPQDPSKNEFIRVRDSSRNITDIKGDPLAITLDFKRAEANRKENEKRIETNLVCPISSLMSDQSVERCKTS
jgi:hypothetical protein